MHDLFILSFFIPLILHHNLITGFSDDQTQKTQHQFNSEYMVLDIFSCFFFINCVCFGCSVVVAVLSFHVSHFLNLNFLCFHHGGSAPNYVGKPPASFPEAQRFLVNSSQEMINPSIFLQSSFSTPLYPVNYTMTPFSLSCQEDHSPRGTQASSSVVVFPVFYQHNL